MKSPMIVANVQSFFGVESNRCDQQTRKASKNKINHGYTIKSKFWYYFFHFGASLGTEMCFGLLFPICFWNINKEIGRKVSFAWALHQYIGNATKELLKIPRPTTPPVHKV
jgi:hypothetical protein